MKRDLLVVDGGWTEWGRMVKNRLRGVWLVIWLGQHSMGELGRRQTLNIGSLVLGWDQNKGFFWFRRKGGGRFINLVIHLAS